MRKTSNTKRKDRTEKMKVETTTHEKTLGYEDLKPTANPNVFVSPDDGAVVILDKDGVTAIKITV